MKNISSKKLSGSNLGSFPSLLWACGALLLAAGRGFSAEVIEDFESSPAAIVEPNSHEETQCEVVVDPAKSDNRVLKLSWSPHSGTHVAGSLSAPGPAVAQDSGTYEIMAKVNLEQCGLEVTRMAIRLVDANNETFQFSAPVEKNGEPGWTEMKWTLRSNQPLEGSQKSWGQKVDGVVDFPIKFYGFAVDLKNWKTNGGVLLFDDISVNKISD